MASSDSDYDYTEDDDDEETDYSDDDEDDDDDDDDEEEEEEEEGEEDEDDSEYSDDEDEDDDEDGEEEEEGDEEVAREEENAEERVVMSSSDNDDEDEQVPALEHGQHPEPDEISEGTDAPCSEVSTPVDPISEAEQPSIQTEEPKEILLKGNPIPASSTDLAPASGGVGNLPTSSVTIEMEKVKIESA